MPRIRKPYVNRTRITGEQKLQQAWTDMITHLVRLLLFREPTLIDYTRFTQECARGCRNHKMYFKGVYIGYVVNIGGKLKFFPND